MYILIIMEKYITLDELINDINNSSIDEYTFLRVLHNNNDRIMFLGKLSKEHYYQIFMTKKIKYRLWLDIMFSIKSNLSIDYKVYRKAYYGENIGKRHIVNELTNYVVLMWIFDHHREKESFFQKIVGDLMCNRPVQRILLYDNKIESFKFETSKYILSSWQNINYEFKNDLI